VASNPPPEIVSTSWLEAELIDFWRQNLAPVKCPRSVDFRPVLPRHSTGNRLNRLLRDK